MVMVHTGKRLRQHARAMRRAPTRSEGRIWMWLRGRGFGGYKFKRQFPIERYVLDFYCPELKLAIELDGRQHESVWMHAYESNRLDALEARGIEVLRVPNGLLIRDSPLVEEMIQAAIARRIGSTRR